MLRFYETQLALRRTKKAASAWIDCLVPAEAMISNESI
jgi:hypothetical protein